MLGKSHGESIRAEAGAWTSWMPQMPFDVIARHAVDFWLPSEDLPDPDNRIMYDRDGKVVLDHTENNMEGYCSKGCASRARGPVSELAAIPAVSQG